MSLAELQPLLQKVEPAALLVPPRILRRVIKQDKRLGGLGLSVPHHTSYTIDRDRLLTLALPRELGIADGSTLAPTLLLFAEPNPRWPIAHQFVACWRLLFHAEVHRVYDRLRAAGQLEGEALQRRLACLGPVAFEEARDVLRQENRLFAPDDDSAVFIEFAAVYLELRHFDPRRLGQFFPALLDLAAVDRMLDLDVESEALLRRTRIEGAPDPAEILPKDVPPPSELPPVEMTTSAPGSIRVRAEKVSRQGNQVRAALLLERAIPVSPAPQAGVLRAGARSELETLSTRLQRALQFPPEERAAWTKCLLALLPAAAAGGFRNPEGRLLYDLQRACMDMERPLFAADLVEWAVSWFQRPIKRPLPDQPLVLTVKHLRKALARLPAVRMPAEDRQKLGDLLRASIQATGQRMRLTFQPQIVESLDKVGLVPRTLAERLSRDQLVEELLDTISTRGTISIGDLRDAIARSRLKLPDLSSPIEFLRGDALLRANSELAVQLDGVYRRGEIYLRWLQSLGSVFFGTRAGRTVTLYLLLPLLGSLMLLIFTDELLHLWHRYLGGPGVPRSDEEVAAIMAANPDKDIHPTRGIELFNLYSWLGLAFFLLPMLHVPPFRHAVFRLFWYVWRGVRGVLYDAPAAFLRLPFMRALFQSKPYLLFWHYLGKPLLWVLPVAVVLHFCGVPVEVNLAITGPLLVLLSVVSNTRLGMLAEEATADWLVRTWELIRDDLVPGLFAWVMWVSRTVFDRIERAMYGVDEMLRFRQGESQISFVVKLVLGVFWFVFTYVFRLLYNVFIEPQINPIKHFPVVTVAHKVTFPLIGPAAAMLKAQLGLRTDMAYFFAGWLQALSPGMWGFLAWELKENWRLYRANQSEVLEPALVGSHGERIVNFIRPGFHSGTLPKLYAKMRRAGGKKERKSEEGLHHIEEELRHFVERELLAPLAASKSWPDNARVAVGHVDLATNRIRIELCCPGLSAESCRLVFLNWGGQLVADVVGPGWVEGLDQTMRAVFAAALTGFYKRAGVDVVGDPDSPPRFREAPVTWRAWVEHWQRDQAGETQLPTLVAGVCMLPGETS